MDKFRIKTKYGYYYTSTSGRYARTNGNTLIASILCNGCADRIVETLNRVASGVDARKETFNGHAQCRVCEVPGVQDLTNLFQSGTLVAGG